MCYHNLKAIQYGRKLSDVTLLWSLIKCKLMTKSYCLGLKESDLLKSKHQTQRPLLYSNQHVKQIPLSNHHVFLDDIYLTLFKIKLLLWKHFDISSVLLFNRPFGSARAIIIFLSETNQTFSCHIYIRMHITLYSILDGTQSYLLLTSKGIWIILWH